MNYLDRRNFLKLSGLALGGMSAVMKSNSSLIIHPKLMASII